MQIWYLTKPSQAKPAKKKSSQEDEPSFARDSPNTDCVGNQIKSAVLFVLLLGFLKNLTYIGHRGCGGGRGKVPVFLED